MRAVADRRPVSRSQSASEGVKNLERWLTRDSQGITKLLMKVGQLRYNRMTSAVPGFCDVESVMCCGGGFAGTSSVRHIVLYHGYDCPQMQSQLDAIENQGGAAAGNAAGSAEEEEGAAEG